MPVTAYEQEEIRSLLSMLSPEERAPFLLEFEKVGALPPRKDPFLKETLQGLGAGALRVASGMASSATEFGLPFGPPAERLLSSFSSRHQNLQAYPGYSPLQSFTDPSALGRTLGEGVGFSAATMGGAVAGAALSGGNALAGIGAAAATMFGAMFGDKVREYEKLMPQMDKAEVSALAGIESAIEATLEGALGPESMISRGFATKAVKGAVKRALKKGAWRGVVTGAVLGSAESGVTEFTEEVLQGVVDDVAKNIGGKKTKILDLRKRLEEGVGGLIPGLALGTATGAKATHREARMKLVADALDKQQSGEDTLQHEIDFVLTAPEMEPVVEKVGVGNMSEILRKALTGQDLTADEQEVFDKAKSHSDQFAAILRGNAEDITAAPGPEVPAGIRGLLGQLQEPPKSSSRKDVALALGLPVGQQLPELLREKAGREQLVAAAMQAAAPPTAHPTEEQPTAPPVEEKPTQEPAPPPPLTLEAPVETPSVSTAAQALAEEKGIDLAETKIKGSGRGGTITKLDVQQYLKARAPKTTKLETPMTLALDEILQNGGIRTAGVPELFDRESGVPIRYRKRKGATGLGWDEALDIMRRHGAANEDSGLQDVLDAVRGKHEAITTGPGATTEEEPEPLRAQSLEVGDKFEEDGETQIVVEKRPDGSIVTADGIVRKYDGKEWVTDSASLQKADEDEPVDAQEMVARKEPPPAEGADTSFDFGPEPAPEPPPRPKTKGLKVKPKQQALPGGETLTEDIARKRVEQYAQGIIDTPTAPDFVKNTARNIVRDLQSGKITDLEAAHAKLQQVMEAAGKQQERIRGKDETAQPDMFGNEGADQGDLFRQPAPRPKTKPKTKGLKTKKAETQTPASDKYRPLSRDEAVAEMDRLKFPEKTKDAMLAAFDKGVKMSARGLAGIMQDVEQKLYFENKYGENGNQKLMAQLAEDRIVQATTTPRGVPIAQYIARRHSIPVEPTAADGATVVPVGQMTETQRRFHHLANKAGVDVRFFDATDEFVAKYSRTDTIAFVLGDSIFISSNLGDADIPSVFGHELVHLEMRRLAPSHQRAFLNAVKATLGEDQLAEVLRRVRAQWPDTAASDEDVAIEEILAEANAQRVLDGEELLGHIAEENRSLAQRIVANIKKVLNSMTRQLRHIFEEDASDGIDGLKMLARRLERIAWGQEDEGGRSNKKPKLMVSAWHGSRADFDRFSTEKMGTGEGQQAFGWGLYFSDLKEIAEDYARRVAANKGLPFNEKKAITEKITAIDSLIVSVEGEIDAAKNQIEFYKHADEDPFAVLGDTPFSPKVTLETKETWNEIVTNDEKRMARLNQEKEKLEAQRAKLEEQLGSSRHLYKVALHKGKQPGEYTWLDWNEDTTPAIEAAVRKQAEKEGFADDLFDGAPTPFGTGMNMYDHLHHILGSQKAASLFLLRAGIDGMRYPTESLGRRLGQKGSPYNYVVFDENAVTIEDHLRFMATRRDVEVASRQEMANGTIRLTYKDSETGTIVGTAKVDGSTLASIEVKKSQRRKGYGAAMLRAMVQEYGVRNGIAGSIEGQNLMESVGMVDNGTDAYHRFPTEPPQIRFMAANRQATTRTAAAIYGATVAAPKMLREIKERAEAFTDSVFRKLEKGYHLRKGFPAVFEALRRAAGSKGYAREKALKIVMDKLTDTPLTAAEQKLLHMHRENPAQYPIPDRLLPVARWLNDQYERLEEIYLSLDDELGTWPDSAIRRNNDRIHELRSEIAELRTESAKEKRRAQIEELGELNAKLMSLRYARRIVKGRPELQVQFAKWAAEGLKSFPKAMVGRKFTTMDELREAGFEFEENAFVALADTIAYLEHKKALHEFHEDVKSNPELAGVDRYTVKDLNQLADDLDIQLSGRSFAARLESLQDQEPGAWQEYTEAHPLAPDHFVSLPGYSEYKGYRVHPDLADAVRDWTEVLPPSTGIGKGYDQINSIAKQLKFYNFMVMSINNLQQGIAAAGLRAPAGLPDAIKEVQTRGELYQRCLKADVFPTPSDLPHEEFLDMIRREIGSLDDESSKFVKWLKAHSETDSGMEALWKTLLPTHKNTMLTMSRRLTWTLDRAFRVATVQALMDQGMDFDAAAERARNFHADYNILRKEPGKWARRALLTPAYQYAMWKRLFIDELLAHPVKNAGPWARIGLMYLAAGAVASMFGYAWTEGYRYVKKEKDPETGEDSERVALMMGPFAEPFKVIGRALQGWTSKGIKGAVAGPLYPKTGAIPHALWSWVRNRDWKGKPIITEGAPASYNNWQTAKWLIEELYPIAGQVADWSDEQQTAADNILRLFTLTRFRRKPMASYFQTKMSRRLGQLRRWAKDMSEKHPDKEVEYYTRAGKSFAEYLRRHNDAVKEHDAKIKAMTSPSKVARLISQFDAFDIFGTFPDMEDNLQNAQAGRRLWEFLHPPRRIGQKKQPHEEGRRAFSEQVIKASGLSRKALLLMLRREAIRRGYTTRAFNARTKALTAYGRRARLLGSRIREKKILSLPQAQ